MKPSHVCGPRVSNGYDYNCVQSFVPTTFHFAFRDCNSYIGMGIYGGNRDKGKHSELVVVFFFVRYTFALSITRGS